MPCDSLVFCHTPWLGRAFSLFCICLCFHESQRLTYGLTKLEKVADSYVFIEYLFVGTLKSQFLIQHWSINKIVINNKGEHIGY